MGYFNPDVIDFDNSITAEVISALSLGNLDNDIYNEKISIQNENLIAQNYNDSFVNGYPVYGNYIGVPLILNIYNEFLGVEIVCKNNNKIDILSKNGGNLGESGCVNWMFVKQGIITISKNDIEEEKVLELLEYDIEDLQLEDEYYTISTLPENFDKVSNDIEKKGIEIDGEVGLVASNIVKVTDEESKKILTLLEQLDDHDDIQKVHTNFEIE